jgi:hypothetical protein
MDFLNQIPSELKLPLVVAVSTKRIANSELKTNCSLALLFSLFVRLALLVSWPSLVLPPFPLCQKSPKRWKKYRLVLLQARAQKRRTMQVTSPKHPRELRALKRKIWEHSRPRKDVESLEDCRTSRRTINVIGFVSAIYVKL